MLASTKGDRPMGKAPGTMRRYSYADEKMTKGDFVFEVEEAGWTVRQQKTVREGWNDSHDTFVVKPDGAEHMVCQKMKSDRVDWNDCAREFRRFAKDA